jgi:hypothetical protein
MDDLTKKLSEYMEDITPLIDCFLTIGFTNKEIRDHYEYGEKLEPKILSQFPPPVCCRVKIPEMIGMVTTT